MAVFIRGDVLQNASMSSNGGVFIGQNIQESWDASVTEKQAVGYSMGDGTWMPCGASLMLGRYFVHQSMSDQDWKNNDVWSVTR